MQNIVIFLLVTYSIALTFATALPLAFIRNGASAINRKFGQLTMCTKCLSFWFGIPVGYVIFFTQYGYFGYLFVAYSLAYWMEKLEAKLK